MMIIRCQRGHPLPIAIGKLSLSNKQQRECQLLASKQWQCQRKQLRRPVSWLASHQWCCHCCCNGGPKVAPVASFCCSPWPQQINKPPPPKLPVVPLSRRQQRNGKCRCHLLLAGDSVICICCGRIPNSVPHCNIS
jgi:hypothetical protein